MALPRMRLLDQAYEEVKKIDPQTAITKNIIRGLAIDGEIKCVMVGRKRLINVDDLIEYLSTAYLQ